MEFTPLLFTPRTGDRLPDYTTPRSATLERSPTGGAAYAASRLGPTFRESTPRRRSMTPSGSIMEPSPLPPPPGGSLFESPTGAWGPGGRRARTMPRGGGRGGGGGAGPDARDWAGGGLAAWDGPHEPAALDAPSPGVTGVETRRATRPRPCTPARPFTPLTGASHSQSAGYGPPAASLAWPPAPAGPPPDRVGAAPPTLALAPQDALLPVAAGNWVTAFGFAPADRPLVLEALAACGDVLAFGSGREDAVNWVHLQFSAST